MKITRLWIDGYGRFSGRELVVAPGLQVLAGPNERGKSTIRGFVCEMLYGQKRSTSQRIYEPTHELRRPWDRNSTYGGRIEYELADGTVFEVQRVFDKANESVRVFDRTHAEDVTSEYPTLRNRESLFAEVQLGMSRSVFLGIATINHASLSDLGDEAALARIREKLISMTDTGDVDQSSEAALKWLSSRVAAIGQKTARKRPLPLARARLNDLQTELAEVRLARNDAAQLESRRVARLEEIGRLSAQLQNVQERLAAAERGARAARLRKAEAIVARIDEITATCFSLGEVRDFPTDDVERVRELVPKVEAADRQVQALERERTELESRIAKETERLGEHARVEMDEPDADQESRLAELDDQIRRLGERIEDLEGTVASLSHSEEECRAKLKDLPDYARLSAEPVEWLTQLASSFGIATKTRDADCEQRDKLRAALREKDAEVAESDDVFSQSEDFPAQLRHYANAAALKTETLNRLERESELLHGTVDDLESRLPELLVYTTGSALGVVLTGFMTYLMSNAGILIATAVLGVMAAFYGISALMSRRKIKDALARLQELEAEERSVSAEEAEGRAQMEEFMARFQCDTVRELEAVYDEYRQDLLERKLLRERLEAQESLAEESEERVSRLFERLQSTFADLGQQLDSEADVQTATDSAISRYQEYRDCKRRANEYREILKVRNEELTSCRERLDDWRQKERDLALQVRQFMRDNDYPEEANNDSALVALRNYRLRAAQLRQRRGQLDTYEDRLRLLDERLPVEQEQLHQLRQDLNGLMQKAGTADLAEYRETADKAVQFRDLRKELNGLEEQLAVVLNGQDIAQLRQSLGSEADIPDQSQANPDELKRELARIQEDIDAARKEEHKLHLEITERVAGLRTLNEVEEERDAVAYRMQNLELELQAATYAMSVLEEVTRERHARIAPRLADRASAYLAEITDGAYSELLINRDPQVRIRVPETNAFHDQPEQALSKGTVDQIYLSLRLAMVESLSEGSEPVPMLLDDPFANYDDVRLDRAMRLLQRVSESHQILFFTCREDVIAAAEAAGAPIIHL